jgi:hypothetical protein
MKSLTIDLSKHTERESKMETVKRVMPREGEVHIKMMQDLFDQLCNPKDWKAPVDCTVPVSVAGLAHEAIIFMTGTVPNSERQPGGLFRLTAVGYRAGPCGDH